jgi:glycine hydroxymethyltransferase
MLNIHPLFLYGEYMNDIEIKELIAAEEQRQQSVLRMIASESIPSDDVREALSSCFTSKYSEGYPNCENNPNGFRYYQGQCNTDKLENLCIERAKEAFNLPEDWHVNVQPYSGSPANLATYFAFCKPGDKVVGLGLNSGGHLSHGHKINLTGKLFDVHQFDVDPKTELIDYDHFESFVCDVKPVMMIIGTTAYSRVIDWKRISEIADKIGAYFVADIAHVAGLIAGGAYPSPIPYADAVTMTTHKTLRGPRGAIILCKNKYAKQIDRVVFPGMNGGPHMNTIAGIAVALKEATTAEFKNYAVQTIKNAQKLADILQNQYNLRIVSGGTDSHLMVVDVTSKDISGKDAAIALEKAGIECNSNQIPYDPNPPARPSGIRLGLSILTTIGMKEDDMYKVANHINAALDNYDSNEVLNLIKQKVYNFVDDFIHK